MTHDLCGRNNLINAVIDCDTDAVVRNLAGTSDPNAADQQGWTALHFAAQNNDADIAALLLKGGASPTAHDIHGNSPLFRAVFSYRGEAECITVLIAAGADPNQTNDHGVSPRSLALTIANYDAHRFFD
ncbi:ankyrin repeat domain-containing protein [Novosphingobium sp.]|uniref:ankyrin repeat domain-containing protein n=1 Tax=Novosphingobium sp. TaxID=1874826 RepID=UPI003D0EF9F6